MSRQRHHEYMELYLNIWLHTWDFQCAFCIFKNVLNITLFFTFVYSLEKFDSMQLTVNNIIFSVKHLQFL